MTFCFIVSFYFPFLHLFKINIFAAMLDGADLGLRAMGSAGRFSGVKE